MRLGLSRIRWKSGREMYRACFNGLDQCIRERPWKESGPWNLYSVRNVLNYTARLRAIRSFVLYVSYILGILREWTMLSCVLYVERSITHLCITRSIVARNAETSRRGTGTELKRRSARSAVTYLRPLFLVKSSAQLTVLEKQS